MGSMQVNKLVEYTYWCAELGKLNSRFMPFLSEQQKFLAARRTFQSMICGTRARLTTYSRKQPVCLPIIY